MLRYLLFDFIIPLFELKGIADITKSEMIFKILIKIFLFRQIRFNGFTKSNEDKKCPQMTIILNLNSLYKQKRMESIDDNLP